MTILVETLREIERASHELDKVSLTRLAARSNAPFDRFQTNLRELQARGLVAVEGPLFPTPKGIALLRELDLWVAALRKVGLAPHTA